MRDRFAPARQLDFDDWHEILYGQTEYESPRIEPVAVAMLEQLAKTFEEFLDTRCAAEQYSQPDVLRRTTTEVVRRAKTFNHWFAIWNTSRPKSRINRLAFSRAWGVATTFKDWERMTYATHDTNSKEKLSHALTEMMKRCRTFKQWHVAWRESRYVLALRPAIEQKLDRLTKTESQRQERALAVEAEGIHRQILIERGLPVF